MKRDRALIWKCREEKLSHRTVFLKLHRRKKRQKKKISEIEASKVPQESYAQKEEKNPNTKDDLAAEAGAGKQAAKALVLNFSDTSVLTWPVRGM